MKYGIIYKFRPHKKVNGTLFYCYEYCQFLRNYVDATLYIVGINRQDLDDIIAIFSKKYAAPIANIVPVETVTSVYNLKLNRTVILDVATFYDIKEFLTDEVFCYSNDTHAMYRYRDGRSVTYFGSYDYQPHDVYSTLKLNFHIHAHCTHKPGVFVSSPDMAYIHTHVDDYRQRFGKPIITKAPNVGIGDVFNHIDTVLYVHTGLDKNNRIIPEAFFHNKQLVIDQPWSVPTDSVLLRYQDIKQHGLRKYTLTNDDELMQLCLR